MHRLVAHFRTLAGTQCVSRSSALCCSAKFTGNKLRSNLETSAKQAPDGLFWSVLEHAARSVPKGAVFLARVLPFPFRGSDNGCTE